MTNLKDILYNAGIIKVHGDLDIDVSDIIFDSREVTMGSVFVAVKGVCG